MRLPRPRLPRRRRRSTPEEPPRRRPPRFVRIRDLFEDFRHALARALGRVGRSLRGAFGLIALSFRRRTALVALVLIAYAVVHWVAVPGVPCSISAAKECPPSDDAIALVP